MAVVDFDGLPFDLGNTYNFGMRQKYEGSLYEFLGEAWRFIDPSPFVEGLPIQAVAEHLEAVARGSIKRLIINIPPRCAKSSLVSVAFPAWVWAQSQESATSGPGTQFLHASYAQNLALRDSTKCRRWSRARSISTFGATHSS